MILIVSRTDDDHARAVQAALAAGAASATIVDLSRFPREMALSLRYDGSEHRYSLFVRGEELPLERYRVVWWRRPQPFVLHAEMAEGRYAGFAYSESAEAFAGLWQSLDASWVNHPVREQAASHKVYQLRVAQVVGLEIPPTLVTNDATEARRFVDEHGHERVAYKAFLPTANDWRETRVLRRDEVAQLDAVRYAPVIFQEYVPALLDLRVTVVGEQILAAAIHSSEGSYEADYRVDLASAPVEPFDLPTEVDERIRALMSRLGLVYGAIDMRLTPDGRFVFFEVNPSGEWLFVEERSGQPITETFADLLLARDRVDAAGA
ncbi:MAG: alpha-L-glutamate ligase [Actinomycetota bacterium]|nr:alpha-L-glutamate ligase [Actinomycetota bacterium]